MSRIWHILAGWLRRERGCPIVPGMTVIHRHFGAGPAAPEKPVKAAA